MALIRYFVLSLLFSLVFSQRIEQLRECVGSAIPIYIPGQFNFTRIKNLSFRNNADTPLAIAHANNEYQVTRLVKCARQEAIRVCARSGGHSLIGGNLCKGLLIDLSKMRQITMQPGHVAEIQPGAVLGEVYWKLHAHGRWLAGGVCPSVGFAGYVLGGGHGPYEGKLGLACDSMLSLRMVDRFGNVLTVSRQSRPYLFSAMCGAGGGQFGIVTSFRMNTASSADFDRGVVFRFRWPKEKGGELLEKWQNYDEDGGRVWFRMKLNLGKHEAGVSGYGACFEVDSVEECMSKLESTDFFNTEGRRMLHMHMVDNALDLHGFFGPLGGWGRHQASNLTEAFLMQRHNEPGGANLRTHQSTFLRWDDNKPTREFWQRYVDFCQEPKGGDSIPWIVCEMNLFQNAVNRPQNNVFAHRSANVITHYIIGGGEEKAKKRAYGFMSRLFKPYRAGVYVNYPELELKHRFARMYWGDQVAKLKRVKQLYDPEDFFMNPQKIP